MLYLYISLSLFFKKKNKIKRKEKYMRTREYEKILIYPSFLFKKILLSLWVKISKMGKSIFKKWFFKLQNLQFDFKYLDLMDNKTKLKYL